MKFQNPSFKNFFERTDKRTNGRTNEQTDKPKAICSPPFQSWGHKKWKHYLPYDKSIRMFRRSMVTNPIVSGRNSNSSKILCMSSLIASLKRIGSTATEKTWIHRFFIR